MYRLPIVNILQMLYLLGGSLELILSQDGHFPEVAVRDFGLDLVRGLHYIHSLGMLFSDFNPNKVTMTANFV